MESRIDYAAKKWELGHFEEIYRYPTKAVFSAQSRQFGPVILKIDRNIGQLNTPMRRVPGFFGRSALSRGQCCAGKRPWRSGSGYFPGYLTGYICLRRRAGLIWTGWRESAGTAGRILWRRGLRTWRFGREIGRAHV